MPDPLDRLRRALQDRYAIQRELGRGGMATVYLAEDRKHHRPVALKVLKPELAAAIGPDRFLREIEISARLTHPHIMPLLDSGEADGVLYYVMPYVDGESLRDRLRRETQLPLDEALQITEEVADALSYAHAHGVIHRDVKPENILLEAGHAVVADFGIARAVTHAAGDRLTGTGVTLGTPAYMSPEQAAGSRDLDGRSDVYSLACVLYEMLAGQPPFTGPSVESVIRLHLTGQPPAIRVIRPTVSASVATTLERALAKTPADRFPVAGDFAEALRRGRAQRSRWAPRAWRRTGGLAVALGTIAGGWLTWDRLHEPSSARGVDAVAELDPARVAVLAIDAPGAGPEAEALATNLAARISDGLGAIDVLTVVARGGVRPYLDAGVPIDSIARALQVGILIDGHLEILRDTVQVAVRLIDGGTGDQLSVAHVQAAYGSGHTAIAGLADSVTRLLRRGLGNVVRTRRWQRETSSAAAFRHVERAGSREGAFEAMLDAGDFLAAQRILDEWDSLLAVAQRHDPQWIVPLLERGRMVHFQTALARARGTPDDGGLTRRALDYAREAVTRAPTDPRALQLRGQLRYSLWSDHPPADPAEAARLRDGAESDLRAAVDANPDRAVVLNTLSQLTAAEGRLHEAAHYAEEAYEADPYLEDPGRFLLRLFEYNLFLDRDEVAGRWCREGAERFPDLPLFYHCQLVIMAWSDREIPDPARAAALKARALDYYFAGMRHQFEPYLSVLVAAVLTRAGQPDSARRIVSHHLTDAPPQPGVALLIAGVLGLLGEPDRAMDLVATYVRERPTLRRPTTRLRPELRVLRSHPRFTAILGSPPRTD